MITLREILEWTNGSWVNPDERDPLEIRAERLAPLSRAEAGDLAFFLDPRYETELKTASPGILVTGEKFVSPMKKAGAPALEKSAVVTISDPYLAMAEISKRLASRSSTVVHTERASKTEIHPTAVVHPTAQLADPVSIGPHCVIGEDVTIGAGTVLYSGVSLGPGVQIGEDSVLFPNVTLYEKVRVGSRTRLHSGVVLGCDGFGYAPKKDGKIVVGHEKIFHIGSVTVGDDVEIGANTTVDRGTFEDSVIEDFAKIDNLVQIGHNCRVGRGAVLCGQVGLSGSVEIGKFCYLGGRAGVNNKVKIGDGARVGGTTVVVYDVPKGEIIWGAPGRLGRDAFRLQVLFDRMLKEAKQKKKRPERSRERDRSPEHRAD